MRDAAGELPDRFEFLGLAQRRFRGLTFGRFGVQSAIGFVQIDPQPHRFRDDSVKVFARKRKRAGENNNHRPECGIGRGSFDNKLQSHRQRCRPQERDKRRKCDALTTTVPAHIPPITIVRNT